MTQNLPKTGVTLYSFTPRFHAREYTLDELIGEVGRRGLGPGLEIVGFQAIKGFPKLPDGFAKHFRNLVDEAGLELSCMGANADAGIRSDRMLNEDELEEYMLAQLEAAHTLGFPTVRLQYSVTPDMMERLLPHAERLDLTLGMEVHSPHSVHHPVMAALLERFEKLGDHHLGFIPDWGASMTQMPPSMAATYRAKGLPEELVAAVERAWVANHAKPLIASDEQQHARYGEIFELIEQYGGGDLGAHLAINSVGLFGHQKVQDWNDILPWVVHVHGKFYDIDADGDAPGTPHDQLIGDLVRGGFTGYISTEWEGWHWNSVDDPFDMVASEQALTRRILSGLVPA
ncbi:MAG: hypothetical protein QM673_04125 [Gordonia sp. (in: high G+C Gram-positive bacteria)]